MIINSGTIREAFQSFNTVFNKAFQIPSFDIMCKIVQTLSISGDLVFYPKEKVTSDLDVQEVIHMLY